MDFESFQVTSGVQADHHQSTLKNFDDRHGVFYNQLAAVAKQVVEDKCPHNYIFLCGIPGSGKSHFLVGLFRARVAVDQGVMGAGHALYVQSTEMITEIIQGFSEYKATRTQLQRYLAAKWLFIDDISKGERVLNPDKMEAQVFRDVLLDRFENKTHLVATSNYKAEEVKRLVKTSFGEYTLSRVVNNCLFLEFPAIDYRRKENAQES